MGTITQRTAIDIDRARSWYGGIDVAYTIGLIDEIIAVAASNSTALINVVELDTTNDGANRSYLVHFSGPFLSPAARSIVGDPALSDAERADAVARLQTMTFRFDIDQFAKAAIRYAFANPTARLTGIDAALAIFWNVVDGEYNDCSRPMNLADRR